MAHGVDRAVAEPAQDQARVCWGDSVSADTEGTAAYFIDGMAFGARHAAPTIINAPEVGRVVAPRRSIPDALPIDDLLALAERVKVTRAVEDIEAHQLAEGAEILAGDLENERDAHQRTVLELTSCREGRDADREEAVMSARSAAEQIADLRAQLLEMTAVAADATQDAELLREGVALARLRAEEQPDDDTTVVEVPDIDPATTSIMDWIVEAVSIDRARATYSPLVALADLIAEWVRATEAVQAIESRPPGPRRDDLGAALTRRDKVERMLKMAGAR